MPTSPNAHQQVTRPIRLLLCCLVAVPLVASPSALRATREPSEAPSLVSVTPLGSHAGELCRNDGDSMTSVTW